MKTFLLASHAGIRLTSIMGTVRADGETLTFVTDQKEPGMWTTWRHLRATRDVTYACKLTSTWTRIRFTSQK